MFFAIPKHLNKRKTVVGLPRDEVLPALGLFMVLFAMRHQLAAFILATIWFVVLRSIKRQFGDNAVQLCLYWWGSQWISTSIFKRTPASEKRYWVK